MVIAPRELCNEANTKGRVITSTEATLQVSYWNKVGSGKAGSELPRLIPTIRRRFLFITIGGYEAKALATYPNTGSMESIPILAHF